MIIFNCMRKGIKDSPSGKAKDQSNNVDDHFLLLFNDDVNAYEYVVECLIEICGHDSVQAEQCTFIAHHKGRCEIRKGTLNFLEPMKEEFTRRGIKTVITNS
jgi:ATP-dependent Clp protease adaptor protein ClpS